MKLPSSLAIAASLVAVASWAHAAPDFTDSFPYPSGSLAGNGPPAGSPAGQGAWANDSGNAQVNGGSALISGLNVSLGDDVTAAATQLGGPDQGVAWVGFYISQATGTASSAGFAVVGVTPAGSSDGIGIGLLDNAGVYGIDNNVQSPVQRASTTIAPSATPVWLVAKLDFAAAMEYIFVNPDPTAEPAITAAAASQSMTGAFAAEGFNEVLLAAGSNSNSFKFNELKIGTSFADVVASAPITPSVTISALGNATADAAEGENGRALVTRTGDLSADLTVSYKAAGSAQNGVDYSMLSGSVDIAAGKANAKIKIKAVPNSFGSGQETVKLKLQQSSTGAYTLGSAAKARITVINPGPTIIILP